MHVQLCRARGTDISRDREWKAGQQGCQAGEEGSAWSGLSQKRQSERVSKKGEIEPV